MRAKPESVKVDKRGLLSKKEFGKISAMHGEAKPGEQVLEIRNVAEQQCAAAGSQKNKRLDDFFGNGNLYESRRFGGCGDRVAGSF